MISNQKRLGALRETAEFLFYPEGLGRGRPIGVPILTLLLQPPFLVLALFLTELR
jgi:hypothetical protein